MAKGVFQVTFLPFDCAGCLKKMENQLIRMHGIVSVKVFPQLGRVRIEFRETAVGPQQLVEMIENLGYPVELKKLN